MSAPTSWGLPLKVNPAVGAFEPQAPTVPSSALPLAVSTPISGGTVVKVFDWHAVWQIELWAQAPVPPARAQKADTRPKSVAEREPNSPPSAPPPSHNTTGWSASSHKIEVNPVALEREAGVFALQLPTLLADPANNGLYALIHGDSVSGLYPNFDAALAAGYEKFGVDPFLVKQVVETEVPRYFSRNLRCHS